MDPKDPTLEYEWFDVGMLTYDPEAELYLVQKCDMQGRILDQDGNVVVDCNMKANGKRTSLMM